MDRECLHKEIDLIQACITRMANNSFLLKGWAISIIAVILALAHKDADPIPLTVILLIPLISLWYLDAFFLRTEKMYRKMYEWVLEKRGSNDTSHQYDLNPLRFREDVPSFPAVMFSITLRWFYGIPLFLTLIVIIYGVAKCYTKGAF